MEPIYDGYSNSIENTGNYKKNHRSVEPIYDGYSNSIENTGNYGKSEVRTQSYPGPQDLHRAKNPWLQAFLVKSRAILKRPKPEKKHTLGMQLYTIILWDIM